MSKAAIIILAAGDAPESLGRVVNAFMAAYEFKQAGDEVRILFDGAGVQAAAEFAKADHKYHNLYNRVSDKIVGACEYCSGAYEVTEAVKSTGVQLIDEFKGHPSFRSLTNDGFTLLTF